MKNSTKFTTTIVGIVSYLYVFLFIYAAVTKLLDYHDFSIKIGQSPILSAFAAYVALGVPIIELIIAAGLCIPKWRVTALFAALCLMTSFTVYIFIILNFSSFVPCSCGGILEKLGWNEHLFFNLIFVIMALVSLVMSKNRSTDWLSNKKPLAFTVTLIAGITISSLSVVTLYLISEEIMQKRNNFVRRFPTHAEPEYNKIDLGYNSFYFAGISDDKIYLGNTTAAQIITTVDTTFKKKEQSIIKLDKADFEFLAPKIAVNAPWFYLFDGLAPVIFNGKTVDWKANFISSDLNRATAIIPTDTMKFALRSASLRKHSNVLQIFNANRNAAETATFTLPAQMDGIFDTDGILLYNAQYKKLQYVYYYRNQYLIFNDNMKLEKQGKTIDTVTKANLKVVNTRMGESILATPPTLINKNAATYFNLLFIQSDRIGKFEDDEILKFATVIDIYDTSTDTYLSSIYLYKIDKLKLKSFTIYDGKLYAITGKYLSVLKLNDKILDKIH